MADAEYASSIAGPMLDWVEDFTGTPYSISKMGERILPLIEFKIEIASSGTKTNIYRNA